MKQSANNQIEQIFTLSTLRIFNLFNNNPNYINNITGIANETGMSHVTIRRYLKVMVDFGILSVLFVGRNGKIFMLNKYSPSTRGFNDFFRDIRRRCKMKTQQLDLDTKLRRESIDIEKIFPFENKFAKVEKLEEDIIRKVCPLCGLMKDLLYAKTNSGYNQKICEQCAIKYVRWWCDRE